MHNLFVMHVIDATNKLGKKTTCIILIHHPMCKNVFKELTTRGIFKDDTNVLVGLHNINQLDNVRMFERLQKVVHYTWDIRVHMKRSILHVTRSAWISLSTRLRRVSDTPTVSLRINLTATFCICTCYYIMMVVSSLFSLLWYYLLSSAAMDTKLDFSIFSFTQCLHQHVVAKSYLKQAWALMASALSSPRSIYRRIIRSCWWWWCNGWWH